MTDTQQKNQRRLKGTVVSDKMTKTVVVAIDRYKEHKKYRKFYKVTKRYKAHDEKSEYHLGDIVMIEAARPFSKEKRWKVVELVKKGSVTAEDKESEN